MIGAAGFMASPRADERFRCTCCNAVYPYSQMATRNGIRENCPECLPSRCMVGTMKRAEPLTRCAAARDGDCSHAQCPQKRDNEPATSARHCPLDNQNEED